MSKFIHRIKRIIRPVSLTALAREDRTVTIGKTLVSYYYYLMPFLAYLFVGNRHVGKQNFDPFFPIWWSDALALNTVETVLVVKFFFVITALIGVFFHKHWWVRLLVFIALWQAHALESSFGYINHQWYLYLYTSLIFVFLPDIWSKAAASFEKRRFFLFYIWFAQAVVMLTYSMAGFNKIHIAVKQYLAGEIHNFSMEAFAYQVADWTLLLQDEATLAPYIINYPEWFWLPYAVLPFIQFFALWTMVRTSLQRIWVAVFALFHVGVVFSMGISFHPQVILIMILFFNTPFAKPGMTAKAFFFDLPIIGQIAEWLVRRKRTAM